MVTKNKKRPAFNPNFPEGALSGNMISKISKVYLSRLMEEGEAEDLLPVIEAFSEGKILEHTGQMKKARETFRKILIKNPKNKWAMEALNQIEMNIQ